jgi:hypothetical protein
MSVTQNAVPANELELMTKIRGTYAAYIRAAVVGTVLPEAFVAALVANESGGDLIASRYEGFELSQFALVLAGKRASYQGIIASMLTARMAGSLSVAAAVNVLVDMSTSWGPCQVMGWQSVKRNYALAELRAIDKHFGRVRDILLDFGRQFYPAPFSAPMVPFAPVQKDAICEGLFHCWNAGAPGNPTADPSYAPRGINRMHIYEGLP